MKIAFIGTHGVGKTSLCYDLVSFLKKKGFNVGIVNEVSRDAFKRGLPINENTHVNAQGWILLSQMAGEIEAYNESDYVVCDRSVLDNYIYMRFKFGKVDFYEDLVKAWLKENSYDFLFKVPIVSGELRSDGLRSVDREFQTKIDEALVRMLEEFGVDYYELPTGGRDKWLEFISRVVLRQRELGEF